MTTLYTIGHGNRAIAEFIALLKNARIECLVDVRAYPRSRRNPQFARMALDPVLKAHAIRYVWEGAALGGMRRPRSDSPHVALADAAHRGYADHTATVEFESALARLTAIGVTQTTAFMCAEIQPRTLSPLVYRRCPARAGYRGDAPDGAAGCAQPHVARRRAMDSRGHVVYDASVQLGLALEVSVTQ